MPLTSPSNNETGRPTKKQKLSLEEYIDDPLYPCPSLLMPMRFRNESLAHHGLESIDDLSVDLIFSFLDIKTLHRIVFTSKYFMTKLTHDHVVHSAVISGGGHKFSTMYDIVNLIKKQRIPVPSPLRLLRLMNGVTCERGSRCRHQKRGKSPKRVNISRPGYGLFVCWQCLTTDLTSRVGIDHPILIDSQVLRTGDNEYEAFIMKAPFYDLSGERAGAILSLNEYQYLKENDTKFHIEKLLKSNRWFDKSSDIILRFEEAFKEKKKRERERQFISRKRKQEALAKKKEKESKKLKQKQEALTKKIEKVKNLTKMVHDHLPSSAQWKNYVLCFECSNTAKHKSQCVLFKCGIVNEKMKPYIMAPHKGTKKAMKDIADKITQEMEMIRRKNFLDCSFLLHNSDEDTFKSAVGAYFKGKSIPRTLLFHENFNSDVLDLVKQDRLVEALKMIMEGCL